jgi:Peptidase family M48
MAKRIFLFLLTNIAVVATISIVLSVLGVRPGDGLGPLAIFCLIWGMGGAFISLLISRWMAKRAMGVQLVDGNTGNADADWLFRTVAKLAQQANLPMPEVGIYNSPEVNAFATGPSKKRSLVAVSTGILRAMKRNELEAVLGHEMSHIANGDMVTMTLLQGVMNAFVMFAARVIASIASAVRTESTSWCGSWSRSFSASRARWSPPGSRAIANSAPTRAAGPWPETRTWWPPSSVSPKGRRASIRALRHWRASRSRALRASWLSSRPTRRSRSASPPCATAPRTKLRRLRIS